MDRVKLAIIGCGGIANWHLNRIKDFPDIDFTGFYDIVPERADKMAEITKQGKRYDDLLTLYDEAKPDAVYVCVPPAEHGRIEKEAIKRGIHMLIQKPITVDLDLAREINGLVARHHIITSVGFQDRYLDIGDDLRRFLAGKKIGLVTGAWVGGIPGVEWWRKRSTSGGQIVEQNIHLFDMLRYFIGEPESVYCAAGKGLVQPGPELAGYDVEDYSSATVKFQNGVVASVLTGCYLKEGGGMDLGLNFYAEDASILYNLRNSVTLKDGNGTISVRNKVDQGMALDRVFIDAVKSGDPSKIRSPYADALKSLAFTLACNQSIDTGEVIKL